MRLAVIDCGTNTFNLIITELSGEKNYSKIFKTRIPVKLGEGAINKGFIAENAFERGLNAIYDFNELVKKFEVNKILAFATSAIRDASNGQEFIKKVKQEFDIDITTIDGDREAELIYFGVKEAVKLSESVSLIMDIGGGSTEFILAGKSEIFWKQSFRLGAARLLEKFTPSNPITGVETGALNNYLDEQLKPLFEAVEKFMPLELIGSSGAFDSLVEMISGELGGEPLLDTKTEYEINLSQYHHISALVVRSNIEERRQIKGLVPMRFDMIVISCLMVDFVLGRLALNRLRVSIYSLKEGALVDFINKQV